MVTTRLRPLALALALSMTSGCVMRGNGRYLAYGADAALTTVGVLIATQTEADPERNPTCSEFCLDDAGINRSIIASGWIIAAIGVALMATNFAVNHGQAEPPSQPTERIEVADLAPLPVTPGSDPEAVRLTQQGRRSGLAGACAAVRQLAPRVRAADPIYYRGVFVVDPPIAACL